MYIFRDQPDIDLWLKLRIQKILIVAENPEASMIFLYRGFLYILPQAHFHLILPKGIADIQEHVVMPVPAEPIQLSTKYTERWVYIIMVGM